MYSEQRIKNDNHKEKKHHNGFQPWFGQLEVLGRQTTIITGTGTYSESMIGIFMSAGSVCDSDYASTICGVIGFLSWKCVCVYIYIFTGEYIYPYSSIPNCFAK